jgi:PAS domain S-box-containing protein
MKILYVEDEIAHVELAQRTLNDNLQQKFVLYHTESLQGALRLLESEPDIDVVLTDLRLPDGSGLDLLMKIRERQAPPAVILVTGQGDQEIAVTALKAGAADYLVKQSDYLHRLPIVIGNAVAQNRLLREQAALREAEIKYQSLVEQTPAVVFLNAVDEKKTTLYISPRIQDLLGYTPEEWHTDPGIWMKSIHPEDRERIAPRDRASREDAGSFEDEYRVIHRNGQIVWVKEQTSLVRDQNGAPLYWQGILLDITRDKENETALQRQLKELTVLHSVTVAGTESNSEDEIIERIVQIVAQVYPEVCGALLLNRQGNILTPHPSYLGANVSNWKNGTPITQGITGKSVSQGKTLRVGDITQMPEYIEIATGIRSELCVPIRVNKRIIGVLNVESKKLNAFDGEDEQFLNTVAGSLGTALERLRLFKEEQQRAKELDALYQATKPLAQSLRPDVIAKNLLALMDNLLGYEFASIYLLDDQSRLLIPVATSPKSKDLEITSEDIDRINTEKRALGQGIIGWVALHGQPIRSGDVSRDKHYLPVIKNIRSELCVPLNSRGRVIGAINIETTKLHAYTERDEYLLSALANSAAIAFENARLYESELARREQAEALQAVTAAISTTLDIETLYQIVLDSLSKLVKHDSASIFLELENGEIEIVAANGFSEEDGIVGKRLEESAKWHELALARKALVIPDAQADPRFEKWKGSEKIRGWLGIPMIAQGHVIGFINIDSHTVNAFSERDATIAQTFANSAAVAIQNAKLFASAREQAQREAAMLDLLRVTTSSLELEDVMQTILGHMVDLIPSDSGTIQLLEGDHLRVAAAIGFESNQTVLGKILSLKDFPINRQIILEKSPLVINNARNNSSYIRMKEAPGVDSFLAIPLIFKGKAIGIATLDSAQLMRFTEEDAKFGFAIANHAAIALGNAGLFESEQKRRQEAETLRQAATAISSTLDLNNVLEVILKALKQVINYNSASVFLHEGSWLRLAICQGFSEPEKLINQKFPSNDELFQLVKSAKRPVIIEDAQKDPRFKNRGESALVRGWMSTPLITRGNVLGYITLDNHQAGAYDESISDTAMAFANQAAAAIENARLYNETQRRLKEMESINRLSSSLRITQSQAEMLDTFLNEALNLLGAENGSVWLYDHSSNHLIQRAAHGVATRIKHTQLKPGEGIIGHVFQSGEMYISDDLKNDPLFFRANLDAIPPGYGGVCVPIRSTAGTLGALMIHMEPSRQIAEYTSLVVTLAEITGNSIHRADLFEQSQEQIRRLTALRDIDSAIASSTDLRVTLNILTDHTLKHLKVDAMDILLYHPELQSLTYLCSAGFTIPSPSRPLTRIGEGLAGQVVMKGRTDHVTDLKNSSEMKRDPLLMREGFVTYIGVPLIVKGQIKGVFEVFHRSTLSPDAEWMQFLHTLSGQAAIAIDNSQLFDNLQRSNQELTQAYDTTLEGWARALELRDRETEGHTRRVTTLTLRLARYMGLGEEELVNIYRGVLLHDIGKMGVPDQILKKTGPLTELEWDEMRRHPQYAFDLLAPIPFLRPALDIPYCHHEHWNGGGYPRGLKGEQIPLAARIFAIVDIWDALLSDRPYRSAWHHDKVTEYLKEISGKILDPKVAEAFLKMMSETNDENKTG